MTIYLRMVGARTRSDLQYRTSFWLFIASQFLITFADFACIAVIFHQVDDLAGWSLTEVAFLYGLSCVSFGVADFVIGSVEYVSERIKLGTFDLLLTRPASPLFQLVADEFALRRFGKVLQAAVVLGIAIPHLDVAWTAGRCALVVIAIASATVIFGAIWVITATINFWTVDSRELANSVTYGGNYMTQYPLPIFGVWMRRLLAFVVPLAFAGYYPTLAILDKEDPLHAPHALRYASPLVAALLALTAGAVWRFGVRHYRSTGS